MRGETRGWALVEVPGDALCEALALDAVWPLPL
jgi:hypothetical protein